MNLPGPNIDFFGIHIFLSIRIPFKMSDPYDNPFWENRYSVRKKKKTTKKVAYLSFSANTLLGPTDCLTNIYFIVG
jgi:hypothetical protein